MLGQWNPISAVRVELPSSLPSAGARISFHIPGIGTRLFNDSGASSSSAELIFAILPFKRGARANNFLLLAILTYVHNVEKCAFKVN